MSAFEPTTQEGTATQTTLDERPDGCTCLPSFDGLPCWPCYRAGFEVPNPSAESDE